MRGGDLEGEKGRHGGGEHWEMATDLPHTRDVEYNDLLRQPTCGRDEGPRGDQKVATWRRAGGDE